METLYDLLGALPRDDAEELRVAFRRAVKGAHPDLHPGDPDAGMKFRQIVRASEILADQDRRATYNSLLDLANQEERQLKKRAVAQTIYQVTSGVIAFSVALGAIAGGYLAVMQMPDEWIPSLGQVATVVRQSTETASATLRQSTDAAVSALRQSTEAVTSVIIPSPPAPAMASTEPKVMETKIAEAKVQAAPSEKSDTIERPREITLPTVVTLQPEIGATPPTRIGPPLDITLLDARAYREHGIVAYRNGDLDAAIADFDQAIQLDPKFIARAKRIEKTGNGKSTPASTSQSAQSTTKKPAMHAKGFKTGYPGAFGHRGQERDPADRRGDPVEPAPPREPKDYTYEISSIAGGGGGGGGGE